MKETARHSDTWTMSRMQWLQGRHQSFAAQRGRSECIDIGYPRSRLYKVVVNCLLVLNLHSSCAVEQRKQNIPVICLGQRKAIGGDMSRGFKHVCMGLHASPGEGHDACQWRKTRGVEHTQSQSEVWAQGQPILSLEQKCPHWPTGTRLRKINACFYKPLYINVVCYPASKPIKQLDLF